MRIPGEIFFAPAEGKEVLKLITDIGTFIKKLARAINGALTFGDGVSIDNIAGKWITFTSGSAGAEVVVSHDLGVTPCGFIVMVPPTSGSVNRTATPWTAEDIFLSTSSATQTVTIFVLVPPLAR